MQAEKPEKTMKAVVLQAAHKLVVKSIPIPKPGPGQVLIKVMAAPINPSDLAFFAVGKYSENKKTPCTAGFQGSGIVIENGGGVMGWGLKNKKVAFSPVDSCGTYAQYAVASVDHCIPIEQQMSFEHGSMSIVNPLTAIAFLQKCKQAKIQTLIHTAAASSLGRMLNRFLPLQKINIINIVRRQQQVDLLKKQGANYVLNSNDQNFEANLKKMAHELNATLCFDAIGGSITGRILYNMPKNSTIQVYGLLSQENVKEVDAVDILYNNKALKGFFLSNWLQGKGMIKMLPVLYKMRKLLRRQLKSDISKEVDIENFHQGLNYYLANMTKGKVVVKPWFVDGNEEKGAANKTEQIKLKSQGDDAKKVEEVKQ